MAHAFDVNLPAAPQGGDPVKLRDEISRVTQRLVRARASYEGDVARGVPEIPFEMQLATIQTYQAKLDELAERLRVAEAPPAQPEPAPEPAPEPELPAAAPQVAEVPPAYSPAPVAPFESLPAFASLPVLEPEPVFEPEPALAAASVPEHRAAPLPQRAAEPQPVAAPVVPQPVAAAPAVAPPVVPQPIVPEPMAAAPTFQPMPSASQPTAPRPTGPGITNPDGTPLVSDGSLLRTEEQAIGEYVRISAELRWVATYRPSATSDYTERCDVILAALAHKHGVSVEEKRESLVRQVEARYRRDYG